MLTVAFDHDGADYELDVNTTGTVYRLYRVYSAPFRAEQLCDVSGVSIYAGSDSWRKTCLWDGAARAAAQRKWHILFAKRELASLNERKADDDET